MIDDHVVEPTETVTVTLTAMTAGNAGVTLDSTAANLKASLNIVDNDSAIVSITTGSDGSESGPTNVTFTVAQSAVSASDTVVAFMLGGTATAGADYSSVPLTVTIPAGSSAPVIIPLNVIDDSLVEGPETVVITLSSIVSGDPDITLNANSAFLAQTQNIADNDSVTTIDLITANDTAPPAAHPTVPPGTNTDNITSINQPTIAGIAAAGSTVQLFDGLTLLGSTIADGTGNWSITVPSALTDGVHNLQAKAIFLSNNYALALIGGDDRYNDFQQFSADDDFGDRYWHVELRQSDENQNAHIHWHCGSGQLCRAAARRCYRDRKQQCRRPMEVGPSRPAQYPMVRTRFRPEYSISRAIRACRRRLGL